MADGAEDTAPSGDIGYTAIPEGPASGSESSEDETKKGKGFKVINDPYGEKAPELSKRAKSRQPQSREMEEGQIRKLLLHVETRYHEDEDSDDLETLKPEEAKALLGTEEDRKFLGSMVHRFARDDLANAGDGLEAAIRMEVHTVTACRKWLYVILTCGLWLIFRPKDDTGVILLTKKGRLITYGKKQQADANDVGGFIFSSLLATMTVVLVVAVVVLLHKGLSLSPDLLEYINFVAIGRVIIVLAFLFGFLYVFSHRPRNDCGSSFRQHFEITDLCSAVYAREDFGGFCGRRKTGQLRLCFTKVYPDEVSLGEGLPVTAPHVNCVGPVLAMPAAMAGESAAVSRENAHAAEEKMKKSGGSGALGPGTATVLAVLAGVGAAYEYLAMLNGAVHEMPMCRNKVKGCSWKVENSPFLGKVHRVENTLLPYDTSAANCDARGTYCNYYYRPSGFCKPEASATKWFKLKLSCSQLADLFDALQEQRIHPLHPSDKDVKYAIKRPTTIRTLPSASSISGGSRMLAKGMILHRLGDANSNASMNLAEQRPIDLDAELGRCQSMPSRGFYAELEDLPDIEPLFEEDCQQLQDSCLAETLSSETMGWWPPTRWLDLRYQRTLCSYMSLPVWLSNGGARVWRHLEGQNNEGSGYGCNGEPLDTRKLQALPDCERACEETAGCNYIFFSSTDSDCILYASCPSVERDLGDDFDAVSCGEAIPASYPHSAISVVYVRSHAVLDHEKVQKCKEECLSRSSSILQCNAYAVDALPQDVTAIPGPTCAIFAPEGFDVDAEGWKRLTLDLKGQLGEPNYGGTGTCMLREPPVPSNRKTMGVPGDLRQLSDRYMCTGCFPRYVIGYYLEFPNLVTTLSQIIGIFAFFKVVKQAATTTAAVAFSGKPQIDFSIVRDPANPSGFDERENAYTKFIARCWAISAERRRTLGKKKVEELWDQPEQEERHEDGINIEEVESEDYDAYELNCTARDNIYIDKRLLCVAPEEKIVGAWCETSRHALIRPIAQLIGYFLILAFIGWLLPDIFSWRPLRIFMWYVLPGAWMVHFYFKLRGDLQCLCVTTDTGRVVQLTRQPPTGLGFCCPHFYGGTDVRVDSFIVGRAAFVQLDMPLKPLWQDIFLRPPNRPTYRRGVITIRGEHGLLQVRRTNGEALTAYRALSNMVEAKQTEALKVACNGTAEIFGISPKHDLLSDEETLIWEWKLHEVGFFTDPFDYTSLLAITDRRLHVSRARCPKPLSCRGLFLGPFTLGFRCMHFQEWLGHHAGLTITTLGHSYLESYATTRSRAPPFWPGFGPPLDSFGVVFMPKFTQIYPAALNILQKPYGLQRKAVVEEGRDVRLSAHTGGYLRICSSRQHTAPKGARVVRVYDPEMEEIDLDDDCWEQPQGFAPEPGSQLLLEAVDHQWNTVADEPWVAQLRAILDVIIDASGAAYINEETFEMLEEAPEEDVEVSGCAKIGARICGGDMLGLHSMRRRREDGADTAVDIESDNTD